MACWIASVRSTLTLNPWVSFHPGGADGVDATARMGDMMKMTRPIGSHLRGCNCLQPQKGYRNAALALV